jgi:hypothetical protein
MVLTLLPVVMALVALLASMQVAVDLLPVVMTLEVLLAAIPVVVSAEESFVGLDLVIVMRVVVGAVITSRSYGAGHDDGQGNLRALLREIPDNAHSDSVGP